ncbi:MAG TPA: 3-isopropylmalate dehydratase small subunit [Candidatus Enterococcus avicola]|uniref:3-isopropylmalate dehydratase small subunit n=1 Tax=Candidatus Enterococcus avicola TaxID=2838561 RepID=A0A9D2F898_9ENTE|nr:3-isopropylmalate dehydratase small subunit [Candidatus Enterococcus avicola]
MEAFTVYQGKSVPFMNDNIDTDQIIPKTYLKRIEKTGFGEFLFDDWRYLRDRSPNPEFVLNEPQYAEATILVTGDNFGSGSSREHAAWSLMDYGFRAIIAESYSDIFYMNAVKNGLLPIRLPKEEVKVLSECSANEVIEIDLVNQMVRANDHVFSFEIDQMWKHRLVNGLDEIGETLIEEEKISAYEQNIPSYWQ